MRSKGRINRPQNDGRNRIYYSKIKAMAALLHRERHQHQVNVAELRAILDTERTEVNIFLKEMQKILVDIERRWPTDDASPASTRNIQNRNVRISNLAIHIHELNLTDKLKGNLVALFIRCTTTIIG